MSPERAKLVIKDSAAGDNDGLIWRWRKGETVLAAAFGNPVEGPTDYVLCIYDQSAAPQPILRARIPAGGTGCGKKRCWEPTNRGFEYRDPTRSRDGVRRVELRQGLGGWAKARAA